MFRKKENIQRVESLRDLKPGQSAVVTRMDTQGALKRRFIDMGITPGVRIYIRKVAPLGDPIEIHLRGYNLSIRKADAQNIKVMWQKGESAVGKRSSN